jgi:hypothetical protein
MRRLSRSILVLCVVVALNTVNANARVINDDQDPRSRAVPPRIVRVIKQIIKLITAPTDGGGDISVPKP